MLNFAILSGGNIAGAWRARWTACGMRCSLTPLRPGTARQWPKPWPGGTLCKSLPDMRRCWPTRPVDVVYIGSIHPLHAQHIRAALFAGKHKAVRKALTLNAAQAQSLFALARERGLLLAEAM